jgi:hypothetical protein
MKLSCGCGFVGFVEAVNTVCPACHAEMDRPRLIDFEEFRPVMNEVFERIKISCEKHGNCPEYTNEDVFEMVAGEFDEYREAYVGEDLTGQHGQINELIDVAVVSIKGVRRLRCLQ